MSLPDSHRTSPTVSGTYALYLILGCNWDATSVFTGGALASASRPRGCYRMTQRKCFASPSGLMPAPLRMLVMLVSFERALMDRAPSILSQSDALGPHAEIQSHAIR